MRRQGDRRGVEGRRVADTGGRTEMDERRERPVRRGRQAEDLWRDFPSRADFARNLQNERVRTGLHGMELDAPFVAAGLEIGWRSEGERQDAVDCIRRQCDRAVPAGSGDRQAGDGRRGGRRTEAEHGRPGLAAEVDPAAGLDVPQGDDLAAHRQHDHRLLRMVGSRVETLVERSMGQVVGIQPERDSRCFARSDPGVVDRRLGTGAGAHDPGDGDGRGALVGQRDGAHGAFMLPDAAELEDFGGDGELSGSDLAEGEKKEGAGGFHEVGNIRPALRRFARGKQL